MARLNYNIYTHISDDSLISTSKMLIPVQSIIYNILKPNRWNQYNDVSTSDALAINFLKKESIFRGNIAMMFDDLPQRLTFTFGVTKSFDENGVRYFLRAYIFKNQEFSFFENRVEELTNLALEKYNSWNNYEIRMHGEKIKLSSDT
ncbi:hypothetical protein [Mucilaginibacter xinganensis]|uniref:Uncharacterized protein n=1 Tax=Mucilaginibacter xinganensis TaxID=1234841 RepID=A0A223NZD0_9SPHI|nr:hypothetical protein [Mucilaginibacter xinganensis]ASU35237.1 hypothetical protein MuYL_3352 [Mucilaginibacter xinganensis]